MFGEDFLQRAIIAAPVILFSLTVHEFFHAWSADKFGDPTAKNLGRLTLNPLAHLDLMGTIMMVASGFRFGWAKPVPVNPFNLRNRRLANLWISAAGPLSNVGLAIIAGIIFRMIRAAGVELSPMAFQFLAYAVTINITLAVFNMIPLFPLDGSHILKSLVPEEMEVTLTKLDAFAPVILIALMFTGLLWMFLWPPVNAIITLIIGFRLY